MAVPRRIRADLVVRSGLTPSLARSTSFPRVLLHRLNAHPGVAGVEELMIGNAIWTNPLLLHSERRVPLNYSPSSVCRIHPAFQADSVNVWRSPGRWPCRQHSFWQTNPPPRLMECRGAKPLICFSVWLPKVAVP